MRRGFATAGVLLLTLSACGGDGTPSGSAGSASPGEQAPGTVTLTAGRNDPADPTIAVLEYLPGGLEVRTGTTVEWRFPGPEPHSVTFLPPGQQPPTPDKAASFFAPTEVTGGFTGDRLANSGLRPLGPAPAKPFSLTFTRAGEYGYLCVIHPLMTGTVKVSDDGAADSQQDVTSRGDEELEQWLAEGRAAKQRLLSAEPRTAPAPGGGTNHFVEMGTTTEHTDVLAFTPTPAQLKRGDSITFVNNSMAPHTASFGGTLVPGDPEGDRAKKPAPGPSPQDLVAGAYLNTGWLPPNAPPGGGPPEAARSFTFRATAAGTFPYVCILHVPSSMAGSVTVA